MVWYTGPKGGSIQVDIIAARVFHSFQSPITVIFQKFGFFRTNFSNIFYLYLFVFPGMSPFRLLYNLEVLLAHLMPIGQVDAAQQFSYDFLRNGGLKVILNLFDRNALPHDTDYDIRQK